MDGRPHPSYSGSIVHTQLCLDIGGVAGIGPTVVMEDIILQLHQEDKIGGSLWSPFTAQHVDDLKDHMKSVGEVTYADIFTEDASLHSESMFIESLSSRSSPSPNRDHYCHAGAREPAKNKKQQTTGPRYALFGSM